MVGLLTADLESIKLPEHFFNRIPRDFDGFSRWGKTFTLRFISRQNLATQGCGDEKFKRFASLRTIGNAEPPTIESVLELVKAFFDRAA